MAQGAGRALGFLVGALALWLMPASAATTPSPSAFAIVNVRVYPDPDTPPIADGVIMVDGDRITAVGPRASTPIPGQIRIVDGHGQSALAGFWNCHVHLTTPVFLAADKASDEEVDRELARTFGRWGFTTVFDLASTTAIANGLKERLRSGRVRGPRILSVGEPFYPPNATPVYARPLYEELHLPNAEVFSPEGARDRVARQVRNGANGIKIFIGSIQGADDVAHMPLAMIRAATAEARRLGVPVFAHPTDREGVELALSGGVDILAHAAPISGQWTAEEARRIAQARVALIPTLSLFADASDPRTPVAIAQQQVRALKNAGGTVLFGTDAGFTEHFDPTDEMALLASAIGWPALLESLTTAPAELLDRNDERGRLAAGFKADIVLVDGHPETDLDSLSRVVTVFRDGKEIYGVGQATSP